MSSNRILFASASILIGLSMTAHAEDIKIGLAGPLSGPQAYFGTTWLNGAQLYVDQVNANGGIDGNTVVLVPADDKADAREGTIIAQRFCDDPEVKVVLGHFNSGVTIPTMDIYGDCGMAQITVSSNPQIVELGYTHIIQPVPNDYDQGKLAATYAYKELKVNKAIIIDDKQAFGQGVAQLFEQHFKAAGGEIIDSVSVDAKDVDFSSVITNLKRAEPGAVYFGGVMPQLALFAKQTKDLGLDTKLLLPDGAYTPDFVKLAGDAGIGSFVTFPAPPYDATPELKSFAEAYQAKFGDKPGPQTGFGFEMAQIAVAAIEAASSRDRAEIIEKVRSTDLDTVIGRIKVNDKGGIDAGGLYMYQAEADGFALVGDDKD